MADRTTTIKVKTEGLVDSVAQAERLDKLLTRLEAKTSNAKKRTGAASSDAALSSVENSTEVGLTRGTAAGGGRGDSRDFARQAQGLGGLVHIYATFAANVFAVSAAFSALSKAMDVTIMQRSADILSGQYGLALNNTAKGLQNITDGAISAAQALEMVNMGATAGLNTKQMEGLTNVAKGASQALGRDLSDAMNRVYRGAIKIEPELLDELGIMVKVNDASKEYARTLNKSVLELTDFEKRQAFVNAVVKQGTDKFSELTGQANPYTKLLARIADMGHTAGTAINSILSPIVSVLNSSTLALAGGLTSIVGLLLGMAIPAIKNYAQESKNANIAKLAGYKAELDSLKLLQEEFKKTGSKDTRINKNILEATTIGTDLTKVFSTKGIETKAAAVKLYNQFINSSGEAGQKAGEKLLKELNKQIARSATTLEKAKVSGDLVKLESATANAELLNKLRTLTSNAVDSIKRESAEFVKLTSAQQAIYAKREADLAISSARTEKISKIATMTEGVSMTAGWKQLGQEMSSTTGKWEKFRLALSGGTAVITTGLLGLVSKLGTIGMVAGVLGTVGGAIASHFELITDKGSKSADAVTRLTESSKALQSSIDGLSKAGSVDKIFEFNKGLAGNALGSMNALIEATEKLNDLRSKGGWLERGWEGAKSWVGLGDQNAVGKQTGKLYDQLSGAGLLKEDLAAKFKFKDKIVDKSVYSETGELIASFKELKTAGEQFKEALETDTDLQKRAAAAMSTQLGDLEKLHNAYNNLDGALKNIKNFSQDYVNSLMPQTNEGKMLGQFTTASASALEAYNISGDVSGILREIEASATSLQAITGEKLPAALEGLTDKFKQKSDDLAKQVKNGRSKESAGAELSSYIRSNISSDDLQSFAKWTIDSTSSLQELASMTANTTRAMAGIGAALRKNAFFEGITGKTEGTVKERQSLEAAMVGQQMKAVQQEISTLSRIKAQQLQGTPFNAERGYKGDSSAEISKGAEFRDLGDVQTKMKEAAKLNNMGEVIRLQGIYQGMVNTEIALGTKNAQLYALKAQIIDRSQATMERVAAASATQVERDKIALDNEASKLKSKQSTLDVEYNLGKLSEESYGNQKRALDLEDAGLKYRQQILSINEKIGLQEEAIRLNKSKNNVESATNTKKNLEESRQALTIAYEAQVEASKRLEATNKLKDRLKDISALYEVTASLISNIASKQELFNALSVGQLDSAKTLNKAYDNIYQNLIEQSRIVATSSIREEEKQRQLLDLETKRIGILKDKIALGKQDLEDQLKLVELGKSSPSGWGKAAAETLSNTVEDRMKSMVSSTKTMVEGVFTAVDTSIDKLGDLMQAANVNWKDMRESLRTSFAKMMRDTLTNSLKNSFTNLAASTRKLFGMETTAEKVANKAQLNLEANSSALGSLKTSVDSLNTTMSNPRLADTVAPTTTPGFTAGDSGSGLKISKQVANQSVEAADTTYSAASNFSDTTNQFATKTAKSTETNMEASLKYMGASDSFINGVGQWGQASFSFLSDLSTMLVASAGGSGKNSQGKVLAMNLLNGVIAGVKSWAASPSSSATPVANTASTYSTPVANAQAGIVETPLFAKGGVMTEYGPLQVQKYASGGVANSPQMAVFGEGRKAEAFVPLPDNRSIPVTLSGGGGGTSNIVTVNVTVNSNGSSDSKSGGTSSDSSKQFGSILSKQVTSIVQEEIAKATRPGGMLYNR